MQWAKTKNTGFTIVELLIVVVVIAILAAITIVSYNGIQNSAKTSQAVTAVGSYVKAISAYYAQNGAVPMTTTAVQCFEGTTCWSGADATGSTALQANLRTVNSSLASMPSGFAALITQATTSDFTNGGNYTGWYLLFQAPTSTCPSVAGLRYLNGSNSGTTRTCRIALDSIPML